MNKETDDIFELRAEFLAEAAESMAELDVDLVSLEKDPGNAALLDRVFRLVHTIKGAAGFWTCRAWPRSPTRSKICSVRCAPRT